LQAKVLLGRRDSGSGKSIRTFYFDTLGFPKAYDYIPTLSAASVPLPEIGCALRLKAPIIMAT
jgi:hypothetical protein